jgi:predicted phosphoribosyltransferase
VSVVNGPTLIAKATAALANNATYLGLASPTTAQTVTQALTRQVDALIRLVMGQLDTIANT